MLAKVYSSSLLGIDAYTVEVEVDLARRLPTILPDLALEEAIETTKLYSVAGLLGINQPLIGRRPFRSPHHTVSEAGLVGGGRIPRPSSGSD